MITLPLNEGCRAASSKKEWAIEQLSQVNLKTQQTLWTERWHYNSLAALLTSIREGSSFAAASVGKVSCPDAEEVSQHLGLIYGGFETLAKRTSVDFEKFRRDPCRMDLLCWDITADRFNFIATGNTKGWTGQLFFSDVGQLARKLFDQYFQHMDAAGAEEAKKAATFAAEGINDFLDEMAGLYPGGQNRR